MKVQKSVNPLSKPIIFIGCPRSGTSVISEIIMRHRDLAFPAQFQNRFQKITWFNSFRNIFDNRYWRIFGQKKQLNKVNFLNKLILRPGENYAMWNSITALDTDFGRGFLLNEKAKNKQEIRAFFKDIVLRQRRKRLAFKLTGPGRIQYLHSIFPDALFIRITRDPIPTISSLLKVNFWEERGMYKLWWTGAYTQDELDWAEKNKNNTVALTAFQIKKIIETTDEEIKSLGIDVCTIKYSDFISNPEKQISKILSFAELSDDPACYNYIKQNKIYNRNKKYSEYFTPDELGSINTIFANQNNG